MNSVIDQQDAIVGEGLAYRTILVKGHKPCCMKHAVFSRHSAELVAVSPHLPSTAPAGQRISAARRFK